MKQVLQNMRDGKTVVAEVPIPTAGRGQALVRVARSLVSAGTERKLVEFGEKSLVGKARSRPDLVRQVVDKARREGIQATLKATFNRLDQPLALGYSSAGTISALGPGMEGFRVGQRVACAGGNYAVHAEYNLVPRNLLTPLPDGVDFESAAFTTLGAIALHGFRLAQPQVGESAAVIGLGLLGLLTAQVAAAAGCRVIGIDIDPKRVSFAKRFGIATATRERAEGAVSTFTVGRGVDIVIICADAASADPVTLAGAIARDRARVVATGVVGQELPRKVYFEKELSFINSRSYGPGRYDPLYEEGGLDYPLGYVRWTEGRNFEAIVGLMAEGKLQIATMISHRFPIEQAERAYELITGKTGEASLGVLLTYPVAQTKKLEKRVSLATKETTSKAGGVRLGVLGAGLFANATLLPCLRRIRDIELVGISSPGGMHAEHSGRKFGFAYAASSDEEILSDRRINTVAILSRHDTHSGLVVKALKAGKHVFVEKPLAVNAEQLDEIWKALAKTPDRLLTVGFNRRFAPLAGEMKRFLEGSGEPFAAHYRVNAGFIPLTHWLQDPLQGGGRLVGEGCHFVDFLAYLAGAAPVSVSAQALPDNGKYRQDNFMLTMTFPDGSIGTLDYLANGDKSFPKERVEVFCGGCIAVLDDFRALEMVVDGRRRTIKKAQDKGWYDEWLAFSRAIQTGSEPPIPYEQVFGVTRATFAAVESLREGKAVTL